MALEIILSTSKAIEIKGCEVGARMSDGVCLMTTAEDAQVFLLPRMTFAGFDITLPIRSLSRLNMTRSEVTFDPGTVLFSSQSLLSLCGATMLCEFS